MRNNYLGKYNFSTIWGTDLLCYLLRRNPKYKNVKVRINTSMLESNS